MEAATIPGAAEHAALGKIADGGVASRVAGPLPGPDDGPPLVDGETLGYVVMESGDGLVWQVIGSSSGTNADDARRSYFEGAEAPAADEGKQYVAVSRRSFQPAVPEEKPRTYLWRRVP